MSETTTSTTSTTADAAAETSGDSGAATEQQDAAQESAAVTEGQQSLGDAGKKALDAMKAERNAARDEMKQLRSEFEAFRAKAEGKEQEFAAAQEAQRVKDEALAVANDRILKAEVRAQAASKLADPQDALRFLDLSEFEVDSDGNVNGDISKAIEDLITSKPYLAAQGGKKFQGSADGGARNDATKTAQLSRSDMDRMTPEQKAAAYDAGQFDDLLGRS